VVDGPDGVEMGVGDGAIGGTSSEPLVVAGSQNPAEFTESVDRIHVLMAGDEAAVSGHRVVSQGK
jgi:hypothetical protein